MLRDLFSKPTEETFKKAQVPAAERRPQCAGLESTFAATTTTKSSEMEIILKTESRNKSCLRLPFYRLELTVFRVDLFLELLSRAPYVKYPMHSKIGFHQRKQDVFAGKTVPGIIFLRKRLTKGIRGVRGSK